MGESGNPEILGWALSLKAGTRSRTGSGDNEMKEMTRSDRTEIRKVAAV